MRTSESPVSVKEAYQHPGRHHRRGNSLNLNKCNLTPTYLNNLVSPQAKDCTSIFSEKYGPVEMDPEQALNEI